MELMFTVELNALTISCLTYFLKTASFSFSALVCGFTDVRNFIKILKEWDVSF